MSDGKIRCDFGVTPDMANFDVARPRVIWYIGRLQNRVRFLSDQIGMKRDFKIFLNIF